MQGKGPVLASPEGLTPGLFFGVPARGISNFRCSQIARTAKSLREIRAEVKRNFCEVRPQDPAIAANVPRDSGPEAA